MHSINILHNSFKNKIIVVTVITPPTELTTTTPNYYHNMTIPTMNTSQVIHHDLRQVSGTEIEWDPSTCTLDELKMLMIRMLDLPDSSKTILETAGATTLTEDNYCRVDTSTIIVKVV